MSIEAMNLVWKHSKAKGAGLCIMLAIADWVNEKHGYAWPSIESIAQKARVSARHVQREVEALQDAGELTVHYGAGPSGVNRYYVTVVPSPSNDAPQVWEGATSDAKNPDSGVTSGRQDVTQSLRNHYRNKRTTKKPSASSQSSLAGSRGNERGLRQHWDVGAPEFAGQGDQPVRIERAGSPRPRTGKKPPPDPVMRGGRKPKPAGGPLFGEPEPPPKPCESILVRDEFVRQYKRIYPVTPAWGPAETKAAKRVWAMVSEAAAKRKGADPAKVLAKVIELYFSEPDRDKFLRRNSHRFVLVPAKVPGYLADVLGGGGGSIIPEGRW